MTPLQKLNRKKWPVRKVTVVRHFWHGDNTWAYIVRDRHGNERPVYGSPGPTNGNTMEVQWP